MSDESTGRLFRQRSRPAVLAAGNTKVAARVIEQAVRQALSQSSSQAIDILVIGAAGAGDPAQRRELVAHLTGAAIARTIQVVPDAVLQLEAAFPVGPGIVLVAGTGSIAFARDAEGVLHRTGGHGFRFGDEGGGYDIGRAAVQAVLIANDGRGPATLLTDLLRTETDTDDGDAFALWTRRATRETIAAFSSLVMLADQAGDPVARKIMTRAATALATHVLALTRRARFGHRPGIAPTPRAALAGGLLSHDTPLRRRVVRQLRLAIPNIDLQTKQIDPVSGALRIARRSLASDAHG